MKRIKHLNLIFLISAFFIIGFSFQLIYSQAQIEEASLSINKNFQFIEYAEKTDESINSNSININMPSSLWNITNMEINFTDVKLDQEVLTIEAGDDDDNAIDKGEKAWAVELNITEDILLFGVYIKGYKSEDPINPLYVQINGYDKDFNIPNETIYGQPVLLNMSINSVQWYLQKFFQPIPLLKGQYFLVVNGTNYEPSDNSKHKWFLNSSSTTGLNTAKYSSGSWSNEGTGNVFTHKLIQRYDKSYDPEQINMSIQIDNQDYPISNSNYLNVSNINISTDNQTFFEFPIKHNQTINIRFNSTYSAKFINIQENQGSVLIKNEEDNLWNVDFTLIRVFDNYSVKFYFPSNWNDLNIFRNNINVTSEVDVDFNQNFIYIKDDSIINGQDWQIQANTSPTGFNLDIRSNEFTIGQELKFSIDSPSSGNYTVVLYDSLGYAIDDSVQTISIPSDANLYTYLIPESAKEGEYHAYIYFFDGFNAGIEVTSFNVRIPIIITFFIILISSIVGVSAITSSYVLIKKHKKKVKAKKKAIHDKFNDIINLRHIMVSEKKSSLNVYEQTFSAKTIDTTLISGFLSAIRSFGIELTNTEDATQTIKLEYKNSKILMAEFKDFRIVLIMNELPSPAFLESIKKLSHEIETRYARLLESFKGNVQPFSGIERLLKTYLNTSFLYPLKIVKTGKTKINQLEKNMIGKALNIMKKRNLQYFYLTYLLDEKSWDSKDIEVLFSLLEKKIFQPVI